MAFAIICICSALVLYTIAIWSERKKHKLVLWIIIVFYCGLVCDVTGTTIMSFQPKQSGSPLHSYCGFTALIIMALHLGWALFAYWKQSVRAQLLFNRFSIYAWFVWLAAFCTGVPWYKFVQ